MSNHADRIVDQFTRQAQPFSVAAPIADESALQRIVEATGASAQDSVLDVACGPGLVACAFARVAKSVVGIDLTPAMIERAQALAAAQHCRNVEFRTGDVQRLPYADGAFSIVVSRLAFHHFEQPAQVLSEMVRVCRPGGVIAVVDLLAPADSVRALAQNEVERLRDPSHVRALPLSELESLFPGAGLAAPKITGYRLELELESWLARSFPDPKDLPEIRQRFAAAVADDAIGLGVHRDGAAIRFGYDVAICVSRRAG
jgi:ubiquinone/menaquinone biosynthesis C-methylase UbiE